MPLAMAQPPRMPLVRPEPEESRIWLLPSAALPRVPEPAVKLTIEPGFLVSPARVSTALPSAEPRVAVIVERPASRLTAPRLPLEAACG